MLIATQLYQVQRVLGFIEHATGKRGLTADIVADEWRPHGDVHAFMEGIPATPFRDTSAFPFVAELERRYDEIKAEFEALLEHDRDRFQSVTSMNYESGWKTLVLYFNGHRIDDFPYDRCPVTRSILDTIPIAGRIAGFNRQAPSSGIPLHSDGNNMWLTCQMGIKIPDQQKAWIRVGLCAQKKCAAIEYSKSPHPSSLPAPPPPRTQRAMVLRRRRRLRPWHCVAGHSGASGVSAVSVTH